MILEALWSLRRGSLPGLCTLPSLQRAAEEETAAAAAAAAAEEERQARLREEYEAAIPEEVAEQVQIALDKELVS